MDVVPFGKEMDVVPFGKEMYQHINYHVSQL